LVVPTTDQITEMSKNTVAIDHFAKEIGAVVFRRGPDEFEAATGVEGSVDMLFKEMKPSAVVLGPRSHIGSSSNGNRTFVVFKDLGAGSDTEMAREIHLGRNFLDNVAQMKNITNSSAECNVFTLKRAESNKLLLFARPNNRAAKKIDDKPSARLSAGLGKGVLMAKHGSKVGINIAVQGRTMHVTAHD